MATAASDAVNRTRRGSVLEMESWNAANPFSKKFFQDVNETEKSDKDRKMNERLGISNRTTSLDPEDEVNEFLGRAIDARSVERLKTEHVKPIILRFKEAKYEKKYSNEPDKNFESNMVCLFIIFLLVYFIQLLVLPRTTTVHLLFFIIAAILLPTLFLICAHLFHKMPQSLRVFSEWILKHQAVSTVMATVALLLLFVIAVGNMFTCQKREKISYCNKTNSSADVLTASLSVAAPTCDYPQYFSFSVLLAMTACAIYLQIGSLYKVSVLAVMVAVYVSFVEVLYKPIFLRHDDIRFDCQKVTGHIPLIVETYTGVIYLFIALFFHGYLYEQISRLDFLWKLQATEEKEDMEGIREYNKKLLHNILPSHVAEHFLLAKGKKNEDLYAQSCPNVAVMFSSICNFDEFYNELEATGEGVECLRVLNQIIVDFDEILSDKKFKSIEKIKTIGETYMAASGLSPDSAEELETLDHVEAMADFAVAMKQNLQEMNKHYFNNFQMKTGLNFGHVVAGVIGAGKPQYDIWGDTVNVSSRMYSTGKPNCIQVTLSIYNILSKRGFTFECRGLVSVKGKGNMVTYWLKGKEGRVIR